MSTRVYEKTEKGREEIATRKHQMPMRLRSVLVMIDGRQPLSALMPHLARMGLDKTSIDELVEQDYIRSLPCAEDDAIAAALLAATAAPRVPPGLRRQHKLHQGPVSVMPMHAAPVASVPEAAPAPVPVAPPAPASRARERVHTVHKFYNETIKANLGLRGFTLQMKVEKAASLEELRALRQPYLEAIMKLKGNETAQALDARLLSLLAEGTVSSTAPAMH